MIEAASVLAPTTCPLCEIELVGNTAAFHSCAPTPGSADGKLRLPAGTTQDTSPLSFEEALCGRPPSGVTSFGMPTRSTFFWIASAKALLTSCGHAEAEYFTS